MNTFKLENINFTIHKPLPKKEYKLLKILYQSSDIFFYEFIKKFNINFDLYINNLINKKNTNLENFFLVKSNNNNIGFYALNDVNRNYAISMTNIFILKKIINLKKFELLKKNYLKFFKLPNLPKNSLYLSRIAILDNYRSKGIGKYLINKIIKTKTSHNLLSLHVNKANERGINFYLKNSFKVFDENQHFLSLSIKK